MKIQEQQQKKIITSNNEILNLIDIFFDDFSVIKRGTKLEDRKPNVLNHNAQNILIQKILNSCFNIFEDGHKIMLLMLDNGKYCYIEKNFKNFKTIISAHIQNVLTADGFENIKLDDLYEHLKSRKTYDFKEYRSPFFKETRIFTNEKENTLTSHVKIEYKHNIEGISKDIYEEIVTGIDNHWKNKINEILDYMVASKYATDKKSLWLLILADSNFGKSKLFDWMRDWDGTAFIDFRDIIGSGINDRKPEDYYGKIALVIDEVLSFHRELFKIESYLSIRPMRQHTVNVPINSRILLSADGGQFNDEHLDSQIINRVSRIDLRKSSGNRNFVELGDLEISKKYGKSKIQRTMSHFLHFEIIKKIDYFESLDKNERVEQSDTFIENFISDHKMETQNFYEAVENITNEILENLELTLGKFYYEIKDDIIENYIYKGIGGVIIKKPKTTLNKILLNYDETLKYELQYKKTNQIVNNIDTWEIGKFSFEGSTISGLFIPKIPF